MRASSSFARRSRARKSALVAHMMVPAAILAVGWLLPCVPWSGVAPAPSAAHRAAVRLAVDTEAFGKVVQLDDELII